jgi:HK97 family phage major capsid protein
MKMKEIRDRMALLLKENADLCAQYPDFDFPTDSYERAKAIDAELADLKTQALAAKTQQDMVSRISGYDAFMNDPASGMSFPSGNDGRDIIGDDGGSKNNQQQQQWQRGGQQQTRKSVTQLVLEDPDYKKWYAKAAPAGNFSKGVRLNSPPVQIPGGIKALVTGGADASAGAFVFNDIQQNLNQFVIRRPLVMRDIVTVGQTDSDTVEYVRQVSETNNAAMVPEAQSSLPIGTGGGTTTALLGGVKPESAMVFERVSTTVKTVAHWIPATKRALADAGQMETLIDNFLRFGLDEELEDQMVLGDGTGENFTGLAEITGLTAQAWDTNLLVTTRKAKTLVRLVGRMPATAYLLNPYDWETIQLTRADGDGTTGPFMFGGPAGTQQETLWNLPVVQCESVPIGVGYVGHMATLILWDRMQNSVQMTDSHADFFVRNMVAILAEARAAFGCLRPAAIVEMDLTAA